MFSAEWYYAITKSESTDPNVYPPGNLVQVSQAGDGSGSISWTDGSGTCRTLSNLAFLGNSLVGNAPEGYSVFLTLNPITCSVFCVIQQLPSFREGGGNLAGQWGAESGGSGGASGVVETREKRRSMRAVPAGRVPAKTRARRL